MKNELSFNSKFLLLICGGLTDMLTFLISTILAQTLSTPLGTVAVGFAAIIDHYFADGQTAFIVLVIPFVASMFTGLIFYTILQLSNVKTSLLFYLAIPFLVILSSIPFLNTYFYWTTFNYYLLWGTKGFKR